MSLKNLSSLGQNVSNIIIYTQSASMAYYVKNKIKETYKGHKDFITDVETQKQLNNAKLDSYVAPMFCEKWLIHVNADKLSQRDVIQALDRNTQHGVTIYWTENWLTYNKLVDLDSVKKQGVHCPTFRFTRLSFYDIQDLLKELVPENKQMDKSLTVFVAKNYQYDVQSVMDLIAMLKSGSEIETRKQLIESIGLGGNSVANLLMKIVRANPETEKARKSQISSAIKMMQDLSYTYKYATIRKFLLSNIDTCIDMKQLQIMGIYNKPGKSIPENFDEKGLSRMKRFEKVILNEVPLPYLINFKLALLHYNNFDSELALIQAINGYFGNFEVKPEPPKKEKKATNKPKKLSKKAQKEKDIEEAFENTTNERVIVSPEKTKTERSFPLAPKSEPTPQNEAPKKEKEDTVHAFNLPGFGGFTLLTPTD